MTIFKYILKSLIHFRRQNLAVMLATIISTAVLTGALIIGDSIRFTLRNMVDLRLGKARFALQTGDRFISNQSAYHLSQKLESEVVPILAVQGIAINPENNSRINKSNIYGIDSSFWKLSYGEIINLTDDEVLISENIALRLGLSVGQEIILRIVNAEIIPINTPFSSTESPSVTHRFKIKQIINKKQFGRFSLKSNQSEPYNIFVSQQFLAKKLELEGLSNLVLLAGNENKSLEIERINAAFNEVFDLQDIGLRINKLAKEGKYELVSERIFIENSIAEAIGDSTGEHVFTYLINSIRTGDKETPYSFVSAIPDFLTNTKLADNEIIITDWLARDLNAKKGDSVELNYFVIGPLRKLTEKKEKFIVKGIQILLNEPDIKSLMPAFPGLSDAGNCRDWETGVPIDLNKIRDKDEEYWNVYRGSPKAYISISKGQKIWQNQFGKLTALRFDSARYNPEELKKDLLSKIKPKDFGLVFTPIYQQGIEATVNAVDFGELFLSLSFFVIVAGVLLTILIHVFNSFSRSSEIALLSGLGFSHHQIFSIKLLESVIMLIPAGILGAFTGIIYNYGIIAGINTVWYDALRTSMIEVHIKFTTLAIGSFCGILISFLSIYFVNRKILKKQVANAVKSNYFMTAHNGKVRIINYLTYLSLLAGLILIFYSILTSVENNSGIFLISGALFLIGLMSIASRCIDFWQKKTSEIFSKNGFVLKNVSRNKTRTIASILLLALGTYIIMITGANRRTFFEADHSTRSGTGAYLFWAETSLPIPYDLNSPEGKSKMGIDPDSLPVEVKFSQFHSLEGDDASCLNLNQVQKPRILGVDAHEFNRRQSFSFAGLLEGIDKDNPWLSLYQCKNENIIPAIADQTVLTWGLKKSIGDTLLYFNEKGELINLLIIAGLNNSIFQGNLLIADSLFQIHFPSAGGSKIMLIDAPDEYQEKISAILNAGFVDYGIEISRATERLAEFNSVTNSYLSVFMGLGGLAVIIGTIGLGIMMMRNLMDRKNELAMMQALGFNKNQIFTIILKENVLILLTGLIIGMLAALIGILPSIISPSFEIPGTFIFTLMTMVALNGFLWIYFPLRYSLRSNIINSLRKE